MGRVLQGLAIAGGVVLVVPPFRRHFDQKIWKHFRNYNTSLNQPNRFNTQEEFHEFIGNLGHGVATFFDTRY